MGKYMKKPKLSPEVSAMELSNSNSNSTHGVLTRSKTLALQHSNSFSHPNNQIRFTQTQNCTTNQSVFRALSSGSVHSAQLDGFVKLEEGAQLQVHEDEHFGQGFQLTQRAIRESTSCDLIRGVANISTHDSSTRSPSLTAENRRLHSSILTNIPSTHEVDELFANFEQQQQRFFMEKYNFDIINDTPLQGRYEWVEVNL